MVFQLDQVRRGVRSLGLLVALLTIPSTAWAACSVLTCADVKINYLYVATDGAWIATSGAETSLTCTAEAGYLLKLDYTTATADWLYSAVLTSYYNNSTISVRLIADGSGNCVVAYITAGTP